MCILALSPHKMGLLQASCPPPMTSLPGTTHWRSPLVPTTTCPLYPQLRAPGMGMYGKLVIRGHT